MDGQVANGRSLPSLARHTLALAALLVVLAPFALAGLFTNLVPAVIVLVAGLVPRAPVSKGTVRLLVAAVVFPLTWLAIAVWDGATGWVADLLRSLAFPSSRCWRRRTAPGRGSGPACSCSCRSRSSASRRCCSWSGRGRWPGTGGRGGPGSTGGASSGPSLDRRALVAALTLETAGPADG